MGKNDHNSILNITAQQTKMYKKIASLIYYMAMRIEIHQHVVDVESTYKEILNVVC